PVGQADRYMVPALPSGRDHPEHVNATGYLHRRVVAVVVHADLPPLPFSPEQERCELGVVEVPHQTCPVALSTASTALMMSSLLSSLLQHSGERWGAACSSVSGRSSQSMPCCS